MSVTELAMVPEAFGDIEAEIKPVGANVEDAFELAAWDVIALTEAMRPGTLFCTKRAYAVSITFLQSGGSEAFVTP